MSCCICLSVMFVFFFFFSSRRRHTRSYGDWSSDVCSSDLRQLARERNHDEFVHPHGGHPPALVLDRRERRRDPERLARQHHVRVWIEADRSEERRVGKECRSWWWRDQ